MKESEAYNFLKANLVLANYQSNQAQEAKNMFEAIDITLRRINKLENKIIKLQKKLKRKTKCKK